MKRNHHLHAVFGVAIALALSAGAATAAGTAPARAGQGSSALLRIDSTPFTLLDQGRQGAGQGPIIARLSLETLMRFGADGSIQPHLAQSVENPNPFTYIYHLRKGIKFWNGKEMTATDVANALNYYRHPTTQTAQSYSMVRDITAKDKYTVIVTLKRRDVGWQYTSAFATMIFEKNFSDAHAGKMGSPGVGTMGTGPWKVASFDPTRGVELDANTNYWGGKVPFSHISVKFFSDETSRDLAFRAGELDVAQSGISNARAFESVTGVRPKRGPTCAQALIGMNTRTGPWSDIHVRRAAAYALNRPDILTGDGRGGSALSILIHPVLLRGLGSKAAVDALLRSLPQYPFSPSKAKQEMAKSRYPQGFSADFPTWEGTSNQTQVIVSQLKKIGINLTLKVVPLASIFSVWTGPRDEMGLTYITFGCNPNPAFVPDFLVPSKEAKPGAFNLADYRNAEADALLRQAGATVNPAKRLQVYGKLLKRLMLDLPYLPLYSIDNTYAVSGRFTWTPSVFYQFGGRPWALEIKPK